MNLKEYFGDCTIEESKLGLSNKNYIVKKGNKKYIANIYQNHVENNEVLNRELVSGFDVPTMHIDEHCKITYFIEGKTFEQTAYNQRRLITFARTLRRFHDKKIQSKNTFNPLTRKKFMHIHTLKWFFLDTVLHIMYHKFAAELI